MSVFDYPVGIRFSILHRAMSSPVIPAGLLDPRVESLPPAPAVAGDFSRRIDGVIIPVWAGDIYLAKACCASVRQHMGDIPIALLVDGPATDTRELQRLHGIRRIVVQDIVEPALLPLFAGTPWPKLLLFWASPYERFLCLDSDTLLWGDIRCHADLERYDFISGYNLNPMVLTTDEEVDRLVLDVQAARKLNPSLDLLNREFANSGVFFARRGVFSKERLLSLLQLDSWRCYDQGLLNYLRWEAESNGHPRMGWQRLQLFPAELHLVPGDRFLDRHFDRPLVVHWIGKKPKLGRPFRAANDYRRLFLTMTGQNRLPQARLLAEDLSYMLGRHRRSLSRRLGKTFA